MDISNTLLGKKEKLKPIRRKQFHLFVCGPTVYDFSHIGHARTYIVFDAMVKYLRKIGFDVSYLQNITDVDDKIIQRAQERSETPKALARRFEKEYFKDMKSLGITSVTKYARATDHIKEIISQIARLLRKGYAYKAEDGIYYDISRFKEYGKLSGRTIQQAQDAVSRIDESVNKRDRGDFALWKFVNGEDAKTGKVPARKSPWGLGMPGWHIEDTAITEKYFGPQYDIHGGARDLIFPHHEAEIAQMEAISGKKPLARYWVHTGFLTVKGEKMSKSLGNFITIRDFLEKHSARILRFLVLKAHYRSPIDYSEALIRQTESELERMDEFVSRLQETRHKIQDTKNSSAQRLLKQTEKNFSGAMEDDLNTPIAIAELLTMITQGNIFLDKGQLDGILAKSILVFLKQADSFFGFIFWGKEKLQKVPALILELAGQREKFRQEKNWAKADEFRKKIGQLGWQVEDTETGPRIKHLTKTILSI